jgi:hypothetical protein
MLAAWFFVGWRILASVSEWKVHACESYVFVTICVGTDDFVPMLVVREGWPEGIV